MYMIWVIRGLFVVLAYMVGLGIWNAIPETGRLFPPLMGALAVSLVVVEMVFQRRYLRTLVAVFMGLIIGVGLTYVIAGLLKLLVPDDYQRPYLEVIIPMVAVFTIYLCSTIVLQTKDQFRFIIPYIDFSKQGRATGGAVLDTSALIDGRFSEIMRTGLVEAPVLVPQFVVHELHTLADSADRLKRARGRRGLENLERLRSLAPMQATIREGDYPDIQGVDTKLIRTALETDTRIVTSDVNLGRVARAEGVEVVDLNELTRSLRFNVAPGDEFEVELVRPGEEAGQAVGYLDDGSMVVVEQARQFVGKPVSIQAQSVIQSAGGRIVFARFREPADEGKVRSEK